MACATRWASPWILGWDNAGGTKPGEMSRLAVVGLAARGTGGEGRGDVPAMDWLVLLAAAFLTAPRSAATDVLVGAAFLFVATG